MPIVDPELRELLLSLDDPVHHQFPAGFDSRQAEAAFHRLAERLTKDFGACDFGDHMEDASQHGSLRIPASVTASGHRLVITVSNFGNLAVLSLDDPNEWSDEEAAEMLHPDDDRRIRAALGDLGYRLVPEEPLWESYDGNAPGAFPYWWDRFFGYL
ncbi:hypothetical protein [Actinoplanes sp. DH11]|uniref:hypothetical protein n=1 Tax=Actinoplanes sp. DH11 TaxID=2857011 RepID=UPI001E329E66|nr:hypothetical protein [Actinoplanes sp. DH11]